MADLPQRKQIRLAGYDYTENNVYYITICTYNREPLFGSIVGATLCGRPNSPHQIIEKWLFELENNYTYIKIHKYVIMPDHIHLILSQSNKSTHNTCNHVVSPLPMIIDWFKTMTTNEYIRGVKQGLLSPFNKRVWQRNYYDHIIRNETEYQEIWQYIDTNPLKYAEKICP